MTAALSPMTKAEWCACVANRLGYFQRIPSRIYERIEELSRAGVSVPVAVDRMQQLKMESPTC